MESWIIFLIIIYLISAGWTGYAIQRSAKSAWYWYIIIYIIAPILMLGDIGRIIYKHSMWRYLC